MHNGSILRTSLTDELLLYMPMLNEVNFFCPKHIWVQFTLLPVITVATALSANVDISAPIPSEVILVSDVNNRK